MSAGDAIVMRGVVREVENGRQAGRSARLLDRVDLRVEIGQLLHVVGPSGAGKSSLVRLINRLDEPTSGSVEVLGRPLEDWPVRELRRRVAMAFQEASLLGLSVRRNLRLPFELHGSPPADLTERAVRALELAGLGPEMLDRDATQLSVGQKQRVALARALITEPEVLLLDEPTSGLDPRTAERLLDSVAEVRRSRPLTMVMVTHRLEEARRMGGDLAVMMDGRIEARGPLDTVIGQTSKSKVRRFLEGGPTDAAG